MSNVIDFRAVAEKVLADREKGSTAKVATSDGWSVYCNRSKKVVEVQALTLEDLMKLDDIDDPWDTTRY